MKGNVTKATTQADGRDPRVTRTRQTVFDTALRLASTKGFAVTTINEISEQSGVSKSTIYRHWDDVEELFLDALTAADDATHIPPDTGNLRDDLVINLVNYAYALTETQYGGQLAHLASAAINDERFADVHREYSAHKRKTDRPMYERAIRRGELPASISIDAFHELLTAPLPFRLLISHRPIDAAWVSNHVDHVLGLAGYKPPS